VPEQSRYTVAHLTSGLVGESDGKYAGWIDSVMFNKSRNPRCQHSRLSRACASEHKHWSFKVQYRLSLGRVQAGE
jgi:hypothetical protein